MTQMFCAKKSIALSHINTVFSCGLRVNMDSVQIWPDMKRKKIHSLLSLSKKILFDQISNHVQQQKRYRTTNKQINK